MNQNNIELQVCADGKPVKEYGHEGRVFIEGRKGTSFTLKIRNNRRERCNVAVLVDGINVVSGDTQTAKGYIVAGMSSYEIQGWRTSLNDVSTFVFKDKKGSYAKAVTGSDKMAGLISVIAYEELKKPEVIMKHHWHEKTVVHPVPYFPWLPRPRPGYWRDGFWYEDPDYPLYYSSTTVGQAHSGSTKGMAGAGPLMRSAMQSSIDQGSAETYSADIQCSTSNAAPDLSLGAGWGAQKMDVVSEIEWQNGTQVVAMELYYTDAKGLAKAGIDVKKTPAIAKTSLPTVIGNFCRPPA
jgi:hypothetical protein